MPQIVKMKVLGGMPTKMRERLSYRTRMLVADDGDEFEVPGSDARVLRAAKWAEDVAAAAPEAKRRGRPPKASQPEPEPELEQEPDGLHSMTVAELREMAEQRGLDLPGYYLRKDELIEMLSKDESGAS